jgi:hypothetical protein
MISPGAGQSLTDARDPRRSARWRGIAPSAVKTAVLNASPVIILARAGFLELVPNLVSSAVIPRAVHGSPVNENLLSPPRILIVVIRVTAFNE